MVADIPEQAEGMVRMLYDYDGEWLSPGMLQVGEYVTTYKYKYGASVEGQMWDPPENKRHCTFSKSMEGLGNVDSALMFRIYTSDFSMMVLPVDKIEGDSLITATYGGHVLALPEEGQRRNRDDLAFIDNVPEGMNKPGTYCVNPATGKIYLWPKTTTENIYIPTLNELIWLYSKYWLLDKTSSIIG